MSYKTIDMSSIVKKWEPLLQHGELPEIKDITRRNVTAVCLENTEDSLRSGQNWQPASLLSETSPAPINTMGGGQVATYDPVLISLVRRAMPNLIAYDLCGVQPMTGPTGLIFAMRSRYTNQTGTEAFYNEVNTGFSTVTAGNTTPGQSAGNLGGSASVPVSGNSSVYNYAGSMNTANAELLGSTGNAFDEMAFSIEKVNVTAGTRALKASYTTELAQDLKAIHGLDAETELANILATEILAEINREIVRTINLTAVTGAASGTATVGTFDLDTDSNGRWLVEKFKGLMFMIEIEANSIAKQTRRGKGNFLLCSSNVASALNATGMLSYTPALNSNNLQVDDTGNTFAGVLNGRMKVYIDPYAAGDYMTIGYKGSNSWDAGLYYAPYVPLQMVRAVGETSYQPSIAFKTRYGIVANPYAQGLTVGNGAIVQNSNVYYHRILVNNIM
jgi:hypothetical protein